MNGNIGPSQLRVRVRFAAFATTQPFRIALIDAMCMPRFTRDTIEPVVLQHCFKKAFESTFAAFSLFGDATIQGGLWEECLGVEGVR